MQKPVSQKILFIGMSLVILAAVLLAVKNNLPQKSDEPAAVAAAPEVRKPHAETLPRIAKVGVTQDPRMYLYSTKTMDTLKQAGFSHFFVMMNWTEDQKLVCMQQWDTVAPTILKKYTGKKPPTLKEFSAYESISPGVKPCTLATLNEWLKANPDATVIVDFIDRGEEGIKTIATQSSAFRTQIIPLVYQAGAANTAQNLGYQKTLLATYRLAQWQDDDIYALASQIKPYAVVFSRDALDARKTLVEKIRNDGMGVYAYTANDCPSLNATIASGADGVMTDSEAPGTCQ